MPFDQRDFGAESCRTGGSNESRRSRANDNQIIAWRRFRVCPVRWMNIIDQGCIVRVIGKDRSSVPVPESRRLFSLRRRWQRRLLTTVDRIVARGSFYISYKNPYQDEPNHLYLSI